MTSPAGSTTRRTPRADLRRLLVAGSIIAAIGLGVRSTFGLFLSDINASLDSDTAVFALAIGIQNLIWGIGQPIAGAVADRFGCGRVLAVGAAFYCAGVVMMARAATPTQLYVSAGFVVGVGLAATSFAVVLASIGRRYPPERRSQALGVATAIGSGGQFVFVQLANGIERAADWQTALVVLGVVTLAIGVLARPLRGNADDAMVDSAHEGAEHEPLRAIVTRACSNRSYLLLCAGFFVCGFHVTFIATHLIPYLEDEGVSSGLAGLAWGIVGLTNIVGSYAAGLLGARHRKTRLLSLIYAARGVVITAFLLLPPTPVSVVGFGASMGVLWLSTVPLTGAIVAQQFGTRHAGTLFGIVFFAHQLGAFVGAYGGGWLADRTESYVASWWIAVALAVAAAVVHLFIDEGAQPLVPTRPARRTVWRVLRPAAGFGAVALFAFLALSPRPVRAGDVQPPPTMCGGHPVVASAPPAASPP